MSSPESGTKRQNVHHTWRGTTGASSAKLAWLPPAPAWLPPAPAWLPPAPCPLDLRWKKEGQSPLNHHEVQCTEAHPS